MNNTKNNIRTTQIQTNVEECGPCPVFASFSLAFALQLRKKHGKTSVTHNDAARSVGLLWTSDKFVAETSTLVRTHDLSRWAACGRSPAEIVGSSPTGAMDICLLWVSCVVR